MNMAIALSAVSLIISSFACAWSLFTLISSIHHVHKEHSDKDTEEDTQIEGGSDLESH